MINTDRPIRRCPRTAIVPALVAVATLGVSAPAAAQPYTSLNNFYTGIRQSAAQAGYTLPLVTSTTYREVVCSYFWGFPLEEMYRAQYANFAKYGFSVNELWAPGSLNTGTTVVAPNLNVLNSTAFLNLSGSTAFVITVPATTTYNVMQILDAYTDVTRSVGTRNWFTSASSTAGGDYLLVGPGFDLGTLPSGLNLSGTIQNPTNQAWLIGRVAVDPYATGDIVTGAATPYSLVAGGAANALSLPASKTVVQSFGLTPLATFQSGTITGPVTTTTTGTSIYSSIPTGTTFYQWLGDNVALNGVPGTTGTAGTGQMAMFQNFSAIGLGTNGFTMPDATTVNTMTTASQQALNALNAIGKNLTAVNPSAATSTNWTVSTNLGEYQPSYNGWITAATTAYVGLGANVAADGVYPQATLSSGSTVLNGDTAYTISFPANGTGVGVPPAQGFWSITVYGTNGLIVPNTGNTYYGDNVYSISSMQLSNVMGSGYGQQAFSILLSSTAPSDPNLMPYWLPTPAGKDFEVIMRIYYPAGASAESSILVSSTAANYYLVPAITPVPEPGTIGLVFVAVVSTAGWSMRRRRG